MTKRVFVSSTSVDLGEYRKRVQDAIKQLGAIDISMENFGARDERPKDECLRIVREESDLFVGIYAHRYGFIPKNDEKSITEQEYEAATLTKIPRFIYIVDDNTAWKLPFVDAGRSAEKLKDFKERLKSNHICKFFTNEDQLASFVAADLGRYFSLQTLKSVDNINSQSVEPKTAIEWNAYRDGVYKENRGVFLTHTISPSTLPDQKFDIAIYLIKHQSDDLSDVEKAEFFFGRNWYNKIYKVKNEGGYIGLLISAYGEFLCTCRLTFKDGYQVYLHRYIDFETRK